MDSQIARLTEEEAKRKLTQIKEIIAEAIQKSPVHGDAQPEDFPHTESFSKQLDAAYHNNLELAEALTSIHQLF